jgi:hypothetical protein
MSNENSRKRDRVTMEYEEVKEEYVGIIATDSIGEPLTSFTLSQFHRDGETMRQNQNISNILDNKEILVHKKPRYEIYENSMMTVD